MKEGEIGSGSGIGEESSSAAVTTQRAEQQLRPNALAAVVATADNSPPQRPKTCGSLLKRTIKSTETETAAIGGENETGAEREVDTSHKRTGGEEGSLEKLRQRVVPRKESERNDGSNTRDETGSNREDDDPHDLYERFVYTQRMMLPCALREIRAGYKESCWLWFVFPTAPYVVDGVERGSGINRRYALRGDAAAAAYLRFERDGVNLRSNYYSVARAVREQLKDGNSMGELFGHMDEPKAVSSFRLFERIAGEIGDEELQSVCRDVLGLAETPRSRGFRGWKKKKKHSF
mmetsp:Transcript_58450/g.174100  ORF Transcript_58450/g.174100 Transcript_58450/m.174100 type:complete len:291 (-) Transcript_58450:962-1834(-)